MSAPALRIAEIGKQLDAKPAGGAGKDAIEVTDAKKLDEQRPRFSALYARHIFKGEFNAEGPTGYHSKSDASTTHEAYGGKTDVGNGGAYQQSVRGRRTPQNGWEQKSHQSTFFPDGASRDEVLSAITSVYGLKYVSVRYPAALKNMMMLTKRGDTVYPDGGRDDLDPEALPG